MGGVIRPRSFVQGGPTNLGQTHDDRPDIIPDPLFMIDIVCTSRSCVCDRAQQRGGSGCLCFIHDKYITAVYDTLRPCVHDTEGHNNGGSGWKCFIQNKYYFEVYNMYVAVMRV